MKVQNENMKYSKIIADGFIIVLKVKKIDKTVYNH